MNDLDEFLKKYKLFSTSIQVSDLSKHPLIQVANLSRRLFHANRVHDNFTLESNTSEQTVTQWGLFFIAHRLILHSNDEHDKQLSNFGYDNLLEANSIFNELNEPFFKDDYLIGYLGRSSQQQFWSQEYYAYKFARNYLILVELHDKFQDKIKVNINEFFREKSNLTIRDFLIIGFSIFKLSLHKDFLLLEPLYLFLEQQLNKDKILGLDKVLTREKFDNFIKLVSGSYAQIRDLHKKCNTSTPTDFEQYEFNPLSKFPLVEFLVKYDSSFQSNENYLVAPNSIAFLKKLTDVVYWQLRDLYMKRKSKSGEFLQIFGDLFEIYVGEILTRCFVENKVINLDDDFNARPEMKDKSRADWRIDIDNSIFIFECKSGLMDIKLKNTFDKESLANWLNKICKEAYGQLESTVQSLQEEKDKNYSEKQFFKFIVLYEDFYFAEHPIFKDLILDHVLEKNSNFDRSNFYIITIRELELLEIPIKKFGIHRIMAEKENIDKKNQLHEEYNFIRACKNIDKDLEFTNSWLNETCDKFFENSPLL